MLRRTTHRWPYAQVWNSHVHSNTQMQWPVGIWTRPVSHCMHTDALGAQGFSLVTHGITQSGVQTSGREYTLYGISTHQHLEQKVLCTFLTMLNHIPKTWTSFYAEKLVKTCWVLLRLKRSEKATTLKKAFFFCWSNGKVKEKHSHPKRCATWL